MVAICASSKSAYDALTATFTPACKTRTTTKSSGSGNIDNRPLPGDYTNMHGYTVNYSVSRNLTNVGEDLIVEINGTITAESDDDQKEIVGTISAQRIDYFNIRQKGADVMWTADEHGMGELLHAAEAVYGDSETGWNPKVEKFLEDMELMYATDLLYLDKMEIKKGHRGQSLGLHVARETIEVFCKNMALVICQPYPMSIKRDDEGQVTDKVGLRIGLQKLRAYWERLGFVQLPGTEYWVFSNAYNLDEVPALGVAAA